MQHAGSWFLNQEGNPVPLKWKLRVLMTKLLGKFPLVLDPSWGTHSHQLLALVVHETQLYLCVDSWLATLYCLPLKNVFVCAMLWWSPGRLEPQSHLHIVANSWASSSYSRETGDCSSFICSTAILTSSSSSSSFFRMLICSRWFCYLRCRSICIFCIYSFYSCEILANCKKQWIPFCIMGTLNGGLK